MKPSPRQLEVLRSIDRETRRFGYPPTIRELAELHGVTSTNAIADVVGYLLAKGLVRKASRLARSLTLTEEGRSYLPKQ